MNNRHRILISTVAASLAAGFTAPAAQAVDVYLRAESFTKTLPAPAAPVTMWGYSSCDATFTTCGAPSSPGPEITVPVVDTSLTIHLKNMLTEASSVMIPGQTRPMTPQTFTDSQVPPRTRIRAFDIEAPAGGGTQDYTWNDLRPGTYLYQSASHVQLQVQMGLYGVMVRDAAAGAAYTGVPYDTAKTVVFSEIDPALHDPPKAANLTVDGYRPSYFLLNGEPFVAGSTGDLVTATTGERVLLRLVNAGLQNRAPQLLGGYYEVVAEDGHPAAVSHLQYNTLLPAGKALDVVFQPASAGTYALYDRRLGLVNGTATNGGQLGHIVAVDAPPPPPTPQTITFDAIADQTLPVAPFAVSASASSGLPVSFLSLTETRCTISGNTVTVVAAGTCQLQAEQAGDATYAPAAAVIQTFNVNPAPLLPQTITFDAIADQTLPVAPFAVSASASSGLPVSFLSLTETRCTISGNTVTVVTAGTCQLQAEQAGDATYAPATPVIQTFNVNPAPLLPQTITFDAIADQTLPVAPFAVSASASSGLPVSFLSLTETRCTISGNTVTVVTAGTCQLQAEQAGDATYAPATPVIQTFNVNPAPLLPQTITFDAIADQTLPVAPFAVSASASSGLPVSFLSLTETRCTISGNTVTVVATGTCQLQAEQAGDATYAPAAAVIQTFNVNPAPLLPQTITFDAIADQTLPVAPFAVSASASSGLPVSFLSLTETRCTISGNTVTVVAAGTCQLQAEQAGDATYAPAAAVIQTFNVNP